MGPKLSLNISQTKNYPSFKDLIAGFDYLLAKITYTELKSSIKRYNLEEFFDVCSGSLYLVSNFKDQLLNAREKIQKEWHNLIGFPESKFMLELYLESQERYNRFYDLEN